MTITTTLLLLAGQAPATFELKDHAAEIYADTPEATAEALGRKACVDFLRDGAKDAGAYKADLARVQAYVLNEGHGGMAIPAEDVLRTFCIDHPKTSLRQAVDALVDERL